MSGGFRFKALQPSCTALKVENVQQAEDVEKGEQHKVDERDSRIEVAIKAFQRLSRNLCRVKKKKSNNDSFKPHT